MRYPTVAIMGLLLSANLHADPVTPTPPSEPTYQGKPLAYWLKGFDGPRKKGDPSFKDAEAAILTNGLASVPAILAYDAKWPDREHVIRIALITWQAAGSPLTNAVALKIIEGLSSTNRLVRINAMIGLPCPHATEALPRLVELTKTLDDQTREIAYFTIGRCFGVEEAKKWGWAPHVMDSSHFQ